MAASPDNVSMALFCDFENVALGVRDAKYEKFDIKLVLERLLLKGSIVVKKAYCDWERYKGFKAGMHEANFELIEIPHVRQSGKNSADIRLVVDALDLCYTKSHVNTFVIISGDSDFSPLVSKLRENAKQVIGVGVKQSTSDLLIANCDEFIFYDDLVRETRQAVAKREPKEQLPVRRSPEEEKRRREEIEARRSRAVDMAVETFDALLAERGDTGKIWASVLKDAIKRRKPDFSETRFGFKAFGNLLDEAQSRGLLEIRRDEKSGTYVYRQAGGPVSVANEAVPVVAIEVPTMAPAVPAGAEGSAEGKRKSPRARRSKPAVEPGASAVAPENLPPVAVAEEGKKAPAKRSKGRRPAKGEAGAAVVDLEPVVTAPVAVAVPAPLVEAVSPPEPVRPARAKRKTVRPAKAVAVEVDSAVVPQPADEARKSAPRARRPRKKAESAE
ncbi:MAG: NYN domain-containing protein [Proteobacteria bacterium]|nr:NYN domain-containing protein [Pseudomonadota bacterium]